MAAGAILLTPGGHELAAVNILMTLETCFGSMRKIGGDFHARSGAGRRGFVTTDASGVLVRAL